MVIILTVITFVIFFFLLFNPVARKRKSSQDTDTALIKYLDQLPNGKVEALIVSQDSALRDSLFNHIYDEVKKTYWVLGVSLTSVVEREATLERMAKNNIRIQICMMNPAIAVTNLCFQSAETDKCILANLIEDIKAESVNKNNVKEKLFHEDEVNDLLKLYNILIDSVHFNSYYHTKTDYRDKVKASYINLQNIQNAIRKKHGNDSFCLAASNAFIPMSMTVADAKDDGGRMIVEFHLPFTEYKVLFEVVKKDNKELFDVFIKFYEGVWEKSIDDNNSIINPNN